MVLDPVLKRHILINAPNTSTAVVWNPWSKTSRKMPDLAHLDYQKFLCVEAGNIAFDLIQIQPGSRHSLEASYTLQAD
jgi:glucose-6-phosphate 1-epimerase